MFSACSQSFVTIEARLLSQKTQSQRGPRMKFSRMFHFQAVGNGWIPLSSGWERLVFTSKRLGTVGFHFQAVGNGWFPLSTGWERLVFTLAVPKLTKSCSPEFCTGTLENSGIGKPPFSLGATNVASLGCCQSHHIA